MDVLNPPFDSHHILRKKKSIKRSLIDRPNLINKKIAIVSGSTIGDIKDVLDVFLLKFNISATFWLGEYNRFYEDVVFSTQALLDFEPDIIIVHTTARNLDNPQLLTQLSAVWKTVAEQLGVPLIQNNFELHDPTFHLSALEINQLNTIIYEQAQSNPLFFVCDIQKLSAMYGLHSWLNQQDYHLYKYAFAVAAIPDYCHSLAVIIKSLFGQNQKCVVLDLDNTLWGGVVGDVGVESLNLGMDTPSGEAYALFQRYLKMLHANGILLAVCSKNNEETAKKAFEHPQMVLSLDDMSAFYANWTDKATNISAIAEQLNIGLDSLVFLDDNPAERDLVAQALPAVHVPNANTPTEFIAQLERAGYFYVTTISDDDKKRNAYYQTDAKRDQLKKSFVDYDQYLKSLEMTTQLGHFEQTRLERITQLINKTNQFNLTTQRLNLQEIQSKVGNPEFITYYATLDDKFGSNGIVSAFIGEIRQDALHISLWVMSCRVFKRELELAILDQVVAQCREQGLVRLIGYYYPTEKNTYVKDLYQTLGFEQQTDDTWVLTLQDYTNKNQHIQVVYEV